jgi:hypothetical protein
MFFYRDLPRDVCCLQRVSGLAGVVKWLVNREYRLEIVDGIRPIQRTNVEIFNAKLVLRQQRTEDEDGVVAADKRLGIVQLR